MSIMLALAACGGNQALITKTYTSSQTVVIPAGVSTLVSVSGQGANGSPSSSTFVNRYSDHLTSYNQRNDIGGQTSTTDQGTTYVVHNGATPTDYCTSKTAYLQNGITNYTWFCHDFSDASYYSTSPATTGASATGFGLTFPGGAGKAATSTAFSNVAVTPGGSYPIVVPAGGSITISYF